MIIGIDLDNTIIDYRNAFWKTALSIGILSERDRNSFSVENGWVPGKNQIKHKLTSEEDNDFKWESLQGKVYGRYIQNASIYPGIFNFLLHSRKRGVKVYIISHKTEFGHHDTVKTPLRKAALNFLHQNELLSGDYGILEKDVFFLDTRREKVNKIAELNCSYFIDDLPEVFEEENFPGTTKRILFDIRCEHAMNCTFNSWWGINEYIFSQTKTSDIGAYVEKGLNEGVESVYVVKGRGNSSVYRIEMKSGREYAGKLYPDQTFDDRDRLVKETSAYRFLQLNEIKTVPAHIWSDKNLNFGLFEWIDGKGITGITDDQVNYATDFVMKLSELSKHTSHNRFNQASAACFSGEMIEAQIHERYIAIRECSSSHSDLVDFLENYFSAALAEIMNRSMNNWPGNFGTVLADEFQVLNPSDFGFHNALLTKDGLKFIDFEYFGWDDPVKLTCDFLLHPGMELTDIQKTLWLEKMKEIFSFDNNFQQRLAVSYCLYGLCWCLIILNVFITGRNGKKASSAADNNNTEQKQTKRLEKSKKLLEHINKVNKHGLMNE